MISTPIKLCKAGVEHTDALMTLVQACYGQSYSEARFYDRQALSTALLRQELHMFIAHTPSGQIISMEGCEALPYFPKTAYLKSQMTLPNYRGQGIGRQVCNYLFDNFDFEQFYSVLGFAITCNVTSQEIFHRHGGQMTGLMYNSYIRVDDKRNQTPWLPKRSHVIMVKPLAPAPPPPLALPPALVPLARSLYASFGLPLQLMDTLTEPDGATVATILPMPEHHNTEMIVDHSGSDLYRILEPILLQCESDALGTCNLFLNAADSAAASVYNTLCRRGFIFSGFKPLSHSSEYLVLHYAAHLPVALEDFILHPDFVEMKNHLSVFLRSNL